MVSGRPLLYLSLPGVAFILGVFWFRRRNKNRGDGGKSADKDAANAAATIAAMNKGNDVDTKQTGGGQAQQQHEASGRHHIPTPSKSMNINGTIISDSPDDAATKLFGKSAPITIVQNGRNSPAKPAQNQQIDSEVLKNKIQDVDYKVLRSIDEDSENLSSPVDLPESVNTRFYTRTAKAKQDEPVVIKATRTPKISPENSFLESKYTKECEQNNNCEPVAEQKQQKTALHSQEQQSLLAAATQAQLKSSDERERVEGVADGTPNGVSTGNEERVEEAEGEHAADANGNNKKRNTDTASPALSVCSVQSGDSGTGSSLPRSEAARTKHTYEFFFPNNLIGHLYGRRRVFINKVKEKTAANIIIRHARYPEKLRVCVVDGTENEINEALAMIRARLPAKRYPNFTMQRIHFALPQTIVPLSSENLVNLQLNLIEGINNDVVVSAVITGGHIFVQHPLHPTHPSLTVLQKFLYDSYSAAEAPMLPSIELNAVCVLQVNGIWYRVQIVENDADDEMRCLIRFLDFGGYMNVHFNELRQIRADFMAVPFQATECFLSNIEPIDSCWTADAADILCKLTKGIVLQAQVAGYTSQNLPEIYLFACLGPNNVIFINKELVARNLANWVDVRD